MLKLLVFICVGVIATVAVSFAWTAIGGGPLGLWACMA